MVGIQLIALQEGSMQTGPAGDLGMPSSCSLSISSGQVVACCSKLQLVAINNIWGAQFVSY